MIEEVSAPAITLAGNPGVDARPQEFSIPNTALRQSALAHIICDGAKFPIIIEIGDNQMWNDYACRDIVSLLRLGMGLPPTFDHCPGVRFEAEDEAAARAYLCALLHCMWDIRLIEESGGTVWTFSHDEWAEVITRDDNRRTEISHILSGYVPDKR